ncbi:protein NO VEIN domain-containing protein [Paeniglutamicibacter terrestris]|uniref:DUF3883 domain-containing protein n=1 Tax=Paeniglutamicibacter terrestris TaxID=2723403 RepID=A0ABX1G0W1_9MICC|nr:DUF3883 domain-containing protein [Paeniglutamicibacter terrestris]NKG19878.1 DUF3883 domain-containing protein [Paeniglutamicibacter terrestris]
MAINFTLTERPSLDAARDPMGRSWVGWDCNRTDEELWEQNRGIWNLRSNVVDDEEFATLSFDGVIQVVARITGLEQVAVPESKSGYKTALKGEVLPLGDSVRDALVGTTVPPVRNPVQYLAKERETVREATEELIRRSVLLTYNPASWSWEPGIHAQLIASTASGLRVKDRWSTGNTVHKIRPGDRAFLLQQGVGIRGIIASGLVGSRVFQAEHWNDSGDEANYALIEWDTVLDEQHALLHEDLLALTPGFGWTPNSSGTELKAPHAQTVERAWSLHAGKLQSTPPGTPGRGQSWSDDPVKRKLAEDHGQKMLERHYIDRGWAVQDTRIGNPYDAVATKGTATLYLEAKATQTTGNKVLVTPNEVRFARDNRGQCIIGIVSDILFNPDGSLDDSSGRLRIFDWTAHETELKATGFTWTPSDPPIA